MSEREEMASSVEEVTPEASEEMVEVTAPEAEVVPTEVSEETPS